jgi:hypothetical protein
MAALKKAVGLPNSKEGEAEDENSPENEKKKLG